MYVHSVSENLAGVSKDRSAKRPRHAARSVTANSSVFVSIHFHSIRPVFVSLYFHSIRPVFVSIYFHSIRPVFVSLYFHSSVYFHSIRPVCLFLFTFTVLDQCVCFYSLSQY